MQPLVIFDFDRTCFMTEQFVAALVELLAAKLDLDAAKLRQEITDYTNDPLLNYDFYLHMKMEYGLETDEATKLVVDGLRGRRFVYDDVITWLNDHPERPKRIVTTGRDNYQHLKLMLAPELHQLDFTITGKLKGGVIEQELVDQTLTGEVWLIDDNPVSFTGVQTDDHLKLIRIARPGTRYVAEPTPPGIRHITTFAEL